MNFLIVVVNDMEEVLFFFVKLHQILVKSAFFKGVLGIFLKAEEMGQVLISRLNKLIFIVINISYINFLYVTILKLCRKDLTQKKDFPVFYWC